LKRKEKEPAAVIPASENDESENEIATTTTINATSVGDYSFREVKYVIDICGGISATLSDGRVITTKEVEKNLIGHIYVPEDMVIDIDGYSFRRIQFSLFNKIKTVSEIKRTVNETKINTLQPYETMQLDKKNDIAPNRYLYCQLGNVSEKRSIFNSNMKLNGEYKIKIDEDDKPLIINANPCKMWLLSMLLEKDDNFSFDAYKDKNVNVLLKAAEKAKLDLNEGLCRDLSLKFDKGEEIDIISN